MLVDGDAVLGILALDRLAGPSCQTGPSWSQVLSNGGLQKTVEAAGGQIIRTPVGDKNILEGMLVNGAGLGGRKERPSHILEHTTSGDGIVTALELLSVMTTTAVRWPISPRRSDAAPAATHDPGASQGPLGR